ncbi:hypothetical protein C8R43DRAFT_1236470 [Mycena crocata]|nr:hypothetical protein C8R43DRAFT_1236470 [Mycena crocata]
MQPALRAEKIIQYATLAASTAQEIADAAQVPFLAAAGTMTLAILRSIDTVKSNREQCILMVEQIHEILCTIVDLYALSEVNGALPPTLLADIAKFAETLRNVHTFILTLQGTGKIKQFFRQLDTASRLKECREQMDGTVFLFRLQASSSATGEMMKMKKNAEQQHEDLLAFLANHPDLTNSDIASVNASFISDSTTSLSLLPAEPKIFHGRDIELKLVLDILRLDSARIVILGMGGMGKTTLATAALNHPDVVTKFPSRYFVSCHSAISTADLVSNIASHIGLDRGMQTSAKVIQHFKESPPLLLVLDNFETFWEPTVSRAKAEEFLSLLTDVPHLALLITMRGTERPQKVKWSRPFLAPLHPLPSDAALKTFLDIADDDHNEASVLQLLEFTGNLPLAVSLMANVVAYEGCEKTLERWNIQRTRLLSDGYDQRSSLDISIMLSFCGARMTPEAQELLGLLSMLPDGLSDADLLQSELPLDNTLLCKATLLRNALAYTTNTQRLRVLVPIQEYVRRAHPPSPALKAQFQNYVHNTLGVLKTYDTASWGILPQLVPVVGNFQAVLADALETKPPGGDLGPTLRSIISLNYLMRTEIPMHCLLMDRIDDEVRQLQDAAIQRTYLIEKFWAAAGVGGPGLEEQITQGNMFFEDVEAQWFNALGSYFFRAHNIRRSIQNIRSAVDIATSFPYPTREAMVSLQSLAMLLDIQGEHTAAYTSAQRAQVFAELLGDIRGHVMSIAFEVRICSSTGNFKRSAALLEKIDGIVAPFATRPSAARPGRGWRMAQVEELKIDLHLGKTEYIDAQILSLEAIRYKQTSHPPTNDTAFDHINLAHISILTGGDPEVVNGYLATVREQCSTFVNWPLGLILCEVHAADLALRGGDAAGARIVFEKAYAQFVDSEDREEELLCLERLADHRLGMYTLDATLRWASVFLATALQSGGKLVTMGALRCLGAFFAAEGDDVTALSVFEVALEGYTLMDVHQRRGQCMSGMGDIFQRRGDVGKAVELWTTALHLYERSGTKGEIEQMTTKLTGSSIDVENPVEAVDMNAEYVPPDYAMDEADDHIEPFRPDEVTAQPEELTYQPLWLSRIPGSRFEDSGFQSAGPLATRNPGNWPGAHAPLDDPMVQPENPRYTKAPATHPPAPLNDGSVLPQSANRRHLFFNPAFDSWEDLLDLHQRPYTGDLEHPSVSAPVLSSSQQSWYSELEDGQRMRELEELARWRAQIEEEEDRKRQIAPDDLSGWSGMMVNSKRYATRPPDKIA